MEINGAPDLSERDWKWDEQAGKPSYSWMWEQLSSDFRDWQTATAKASVKLF